MPDKVRFWAFSPFLSSPTSQSFRGSPPKHSVSKRTQIENPSMEFKLSTVVSGSY